MSLENGYLLNQRYRIVDILGQGGMGAVYRAVDENLDIVVAVKENSFLSEEYSRQFQREARILAALRHPNLPRVFDYFVIDQEGQYLVMDFIEGQDLRQWMSQEESLSEIEALQIGLEICDALIYLHSQNPVITHRDIKPGNIKITPTGEVVLVDFGLVKLLEGHQKTTTAAKAMTPGYSPPEQYGDSSTDERTDIFSLGATLYAALAGYLPEDSLARSTGKATLTPLRHYNPSVSQDTAKAIEKALKINCDERWQSAAAFKEALLKAREKIPRDKWQELSQHPMLFNEESITDGDDPTQTTRPSSKAKSGKRVDPVWLIFVITIVMVVSLFGASLIWPELFQSILVGDSQSEPTATLNVLINTQTATRQIASPEITETPFRLSIDPDVTETITAAPTATVTIADPTQPVTPSPTPLGGGVGMMAYVSERTGKPQIWLYDVRSRVTTQLTDLDDGACQPDWSPSGIQIVFTSPCLSKRTSYPGSSLYVVDVDSGNVFPLPGSLEGDFDPSWSPDGGWIAHTSLINGKMQLIKTDLDTKERVRLSDGKYEDSDPAWSPDGEQLAFVRVRSVAQIWLMDADGANPVQFTMSGLIDNSNPAWFPDQSLILFSQVLGMGSPSKQILGMRVEDIGKEEEYSVVPTAQDSYIPLMDNVDVSPDGYWLAFDYWYFDVLSDIYVMTFPGGNLIQLTMHPSPDYDPVWLD